MPGWPVIDTQIQTQTLLCLFVSSELFLTLLWFNSTPGSQTIE